MKLVLGSVLFLMMTIPAWAKDCRTESEYNVRKDPIWGNLKANSKNAGEQAMMDKLALEEDVLVCQNKRLRALVAKLEKKWPVTTQPAPMAVKIR